MIYCTFPLSALFGDVDSRAQFMWCLVKWEDFIGLVAKNFKRHGCSMFLIYPSTQKQKTTSEPAENQTWYLYIHVTVAVIACLHLCCSVL
jgi:hypothetical protein